MYSLVGFGFASLILYLSLPATEACTLRGRFLHVPSPNSKFTPEYDSRGLASFYYTLGDQPSLTDIASSLGIHGHKLLPKPEENDNSKICRDNAYRSRVDDSIRRVLNYYEAHMDKLRLPDYILGLAVLKGSKQGERFEETHSLSRWIPELCKQSYDQEAEISGCIALTSNITRKQTGPGRWQPANLVQAASQQFNSDEIGQEKELIWSGLNTECFKATLFRCEIPHVCERVFFDPKPRSQYMLTHQLLHRMVAEQPDCLQDITRHADPNVNLNLCAKMYKESEYVSGLQRRLGLSYLEDLQAEFVAFCGYAGYPNFFRADILDDLLLFQSKSDYGCFLNKDQEKFFTSHAPILRRLTKAEEKSGEQYPKEFCDPHFSSVALSALAMFADYIEDGCVM